jgi:hypothetical protein
MGKLTAGRIKFLKRGFGMETFFVIIVRAVLRPKILKNLIAEAFFDIQAGAHLGNNPLLNPRNNLQLYFTNNFIISRRDIVKLLPGSRIFDDEKDSGKSPRNYSQ